MLSRYLEILRDVYDAGEARAVFYRLVEDTFGLSRTDVCLGALDNLTEEQKSLLDADLKRLAHGEPVQYVVGYEYFHGMKFHVEEGVLIPRPETEELVDLIVSKSDCIKGDRRGMRYVLDIGCGSGAIAVSLAKLLSNVDVSAWDVSDTALRVTRRNAQSNGVGVDIYMQDALSAPSGDNDMWDIIVSNPPYVCTSEAKDMTVQVLEHEPHIALFVPDADPLLFYRSIAEYATHALRKGGMLFFEINELYGKETCSMLEGLGFWGVELLKDQFGKDRMICAKCTKNAVL